MAGDYYSILNVKRDASDKEIRSAYRRLARKYHPDVNPGDKAAEQTFKEINAAYEVLSDPESRKKYDKYGDNWRLADQFEQARGQSAGQWWSTMREAGAPGGGGGDFDLGGLGSEFGSIFDTLFRGGRRARRGRERGQDIEQPVEITLEEAYSGTARTLAMQLQQPCATCGGDGKIAGAVCHVCGGSGIETKSHRIELKIPAGARTGSRVRIAGEGGSGPGGARGDLYVIVTVLPHATFERKGDDLYVDVTLPVVDAVLGGEVEVPTLRGKRVLLTVPPHTQNGKTFRLNGLGMPKLGGSGRGDLYARVHVTVPEKLGDDERKLFEQLREMRKHRPSGVS